MSDPKAGGRDQNDTYQDEDSLVMSEHGEDQRTIQITKFKSQEKRIPKPAAYTYQGTQKQLQPC